MKRLIKKTKPEVKIEPKPSLSVEEKIEALAKTETPKSPAEETPVEEAVETEDKRNIEEMPIKEVKVVESSSLVIRSIVPAIVGIVVGIITALTTIIIYNSQMVKTPAEITPTPAISKAMEVSEPTATTSAESVVKDLALFDIKVQNGSGKGGEAGRIEKLLKEKGFSVLEIGNADKSDYKKTIIKAKKKVTPDYLSQLESVLGEILDIEKPTSDLADSEKADLVIIVGSSTP